VVAPIKKPAPITAQNINDVAGAAADRLAEVCRCTGATSLRLDAGEGRGRVVVVIARGAEAADVVARAYDALRPGLELGRTLDEFGVRWQGDHRADVVDDGAKDRPRDNDEA